jgi:type IX secretion system substrate protein/NHL repeat-containing protein
MKKIATATILFLISLFTVNFTYAQIGKIVTWATVSACNIALDPAGKVYTASGSVVYKVDSGGLETVVAGGGSGYGDGGPATAASLSNAYNLAFDKAGNMYISDAGYGVVRKVNTAGIISTVAGNHTLGTGYTGDGGPATAAKVNCTTVCVDVTGNVYIADEPDLVIRKVNTSGIITTVAGNGTSGYSGDGGPATAASLQNYTEANIWGIATDLIGNLYISTGHGYRVRKVNAAGIITTVAGNGSAGHSGIGGPAIAANIYYPEGLTTDAAGNLYISQWQNCVLTAVNTAGILSTIAGNYTISYSGDGGPATAAGLNAASDVAIDANGDIYIADCHNFCIRKITGSYLSATHVADSFGVNINELCSGPQLNIVTQSYNSAYSVKCYYGDGTTDLSALTASFSGTGFVNFTHTYRNPGTYTIKTVLMNGPTVFDSISYAYEYIQCATMPVKFFWDNNGNCIQDPGESSNTKPLLVQVDSNGVHVDSLSCTSGIYYTGHGVPGDVYAFRVLSPSSGVTVTCPGTGVIYDTISSGVYNLSTKYAGVQCPTSGYDLTVSDVIPVTGVHDQWGNIYVNNNYCTPTNATVTLHYDKQYNVVMGGGGLDVSPTPSAYTDSTITWNVTGLSSATGPADLYYAIWTDHAHGLLTAGDITHTYVTVSPNIGDLDTSNNHTTIIDTVRAGCDPNEMSVTPGGCIVSGVSAIPMQYTISFTNVGNDTAFNIYVMDTLPASLDPKSLRIVMASNTMNINVFNDGGYNIVKFDFPGINLIDSATCPQCAGSVVFNINSIPGLPDGASIPNHAGVFFDINPAVLTNSVENRIGGCTPTLAVSAVQANAGIRVYPNPASTELNIDAPAPINQVTISNLVGQIVYTCDYNTSYARIDITNLSSGVYFIKINGSEVRKFVKE